jgi:hypothetical protein
MKEDGEINEKAKPVVKQGRKAKGSLGEIAWLPKKI